MPALAELAAAVTQSVAEGDPTADKNVKTVLGALDAHHMRELLVSVIDESLRSAFKDIVVEYMEGMFKDLKDNQRMLIQEKQWLMTDERPPKSSQVSQKNLSPFSPSTSSCKSQRLAPMCNVYSDGWCKPTGTGSFVRVKDAMRRAEAMQAQSLVGTSITPLPVKSVCEGIDGSVGSGAPPSPKAFSSGSSEGEPVSTERHSTSPAESCLGLTRFNRDRECHGPTSPQRTFNSEINSPCDEIDSEAAYQVHVPVHDELDNVGEIDFLSSPFYESQTQTRHDFCSVVAKPESSRRSFASFLRRTTEDSVSPVASEELDKPREQGVGDTGMVSMRGLPCTVWRACGILPWSTRRCTFVYRYMVIFLFGCFSLLSALSFVHQPERWGENLIMCGISLFATVLLVVIGRVDALISSAQPLLETHARKCCFLREWELDGVRGIAVNAFVCIIITVINVTVGIMLDQQRLPWLCLSSFAVCMLIMMVQCLAHIFTFLDILVNSFIDRLLTSMDYKAAVNSWNVVQGLLRVVSKEMESSLLACHVAVTLAASAFSLCLAMMLRAVSSTPVPGDFFPKAHVYGNIMACLNVTIVTACSLRVFIKAARVTETCRRLPSLVNSFDFTDGITMDQERHYVVNFIANSAAGVYLKGVRLSASVMIKATYVLGAVICTVGTTAMSGS